MRHAARAADWGLADWGMDEATSSPNDLAIQTPEEHTIKHSKHAAAEHNTCAREQQQRQSGAQRQQCEQSGQSCSSERAEQQMQQAAGLIQRQL